MEMSLAKANTPMRGAGSEPNLVHWQTKADEDGWLLAVRTSSLEPPHWSTLTTWYRSDDPFQGWEGPVIRPHVPPSPRTAVLCADGVVRVFTSETPEPPARGYRHPLCCWDIDPTTFDYSNRQVVIDVEKEGLPFRAPFVDIPKLLPPHNGRQIIVTRAINGNMTCNWSNDPDPPSDAAMEYAGIHYAEIEYDQPVGDLWAFD